MESNVDIFGRRTFFIAPDAILFFNIDAIVDDIPDWKAYIANLKEKHSNDALIGGQLVRAAMDSASHFSFEFNRKKFKSKVLDVNISHFACVFPEDDTLSTLRKAFKKADN